MVSARSGICVFIFSLTLLLVSPSAFCGMRLRILFTHDLHSTLTPRMVVSDNGRRMQSGGFARLASALQKASLDNPNGTLIVDGGDFTMGTLFHTLFLTESPEIRLMGAMGYDVVTFGNHDFDFHPEGLTRYLGNAREKGGRLPAISTGNLNLTIRNREIDSLAHQLHVSDVQPFFVLQRNNVRIGVFGVMGNDAADDVPFVNPATFDDPIASARLCVKKLRDSARVDVVVCLSHSGTAANNSSNEDLRLAREVPEIDVIVSGHTHRILQKPIMVGNTAICSAGSFGSHLGIVDLEVTSNDRPRIVHYALMPIDSTLHGKESVSSAIDGYSARIDSDLLSPMGLAGTQVIAESPFDFESMDYIYTHPGEHRLGDMAADAYRFAVANAEGPAAAPIDVAIVPVGMIRGSFLSGPLTVADVFRVLSLGLGPDRQPGYPLLATYVTGADLRNTLEIETTISLLKDDARLQFAGIHFRYNPYRVPLNRVTDAALIDSSGRLHPIADDSLYRVCICLYSGIMLANVSSLSRGFLTIQPRRRDGTPIADWHETFVDGDPARPGTQELKEWVALSRYLRSFPPARPGGPPCLPARYNTSAGRFSAEASLNPADLVRNPNRFTAIAAVLAAGAITVPVWLILRLSRRLRRR